MKFRTTKQYHRAMADQKQKHLASMATGLKKPSEKAHEWFRRPAYFIGKKEVTTDERIN